MKRYLYSILLAALTIVPMNFSSCSDDDDDANTENQSNNNTDNPSDNSAIENTDYLKYTITSENEVSVSGVKGNVPANVVIPEQVTIDGKTYAVTGIASSAFKGCSTMSIVTIPNSVTAIGDSAFYNCGSLINASIPDSVTSIADYTFAECKSLTNVTIPDGVIKIGERAFENCSSLNNVSIPSSVDSILFHAFQGCEKADIVINLESDSLPYTNSSFYRVHSVLYSGSIVQDYDNGNFESGMVCGYPYVDLGLPSGLKWASYNVGATSVSQFGDSFNDTIDVATANWCDSWRLPTKDELQELIRGCDWQWTILSPGVGGNLGTSKTNGKQIFLPDEKDETGNFYMSSTYEYTYIIRPSWGIHGGYYHLYSGSYGLSVDYAWGNMYSTARAVTE